MNTKEIKKILLVGNPNVGKSVIFQRLTGRYAVVSNYPGTTVEVTKGKICCVPQNGRFACDKCKANIFRKKSETSREIEIIDTPGVHSLLPMSEDERVTRDIVVQEMGKSIVIQVADAKNLSHSLIITMELAELGIPTVLAINMIDEAERSGIEIDINRLEKVLKIPVIPLIAVQGKGLIDLLGAIEKASVPNINLEYDSSIENEIIELSRHLPEKYKENRGIITMLLSHDDSLIDLLFGKESPQGKEIDRLIHEFHRSKQVSPRYLLMSTRAEKARDIAKRITKRKKNTESSIGARLGQLLLKPHWGWLTTIVVLYFAYRIVGVFAAGTVVDWFENDIFGTFETVGLNPQGIPTTQQSVILKAPNKVVYPKNSWWSLIHKKHVKLPEDEGVILMIGAKYIGKRNDRLLFELTAKARRIEEQEPPESIWRTLFRTFVYDIGPKGKTRLVASPIEPQHIILRAIPAGDVKITPLGVRKDNKAFTNETFKLEVPANLLSKKSITVRGTVITGVVNPYLVRLADSITWQPLYEFLVGKYGVIPIAITYSLAIILPIVTFFFIVFSLLEDSGFMPRIAILMNRGFRVVGLSGQAVLPMLLGLGCDTMATLTTRVLKTRKERLITTILLTLGIPCSAQLGIIAAITSSYPKVLLVFVITVLISLLIVGIAAKKLLPGESGDFVMEIPPMRLPSMKNITFKTLLRMKWYLFEAIPLFILGTILLYFMDLTGVLATIENLLRPLTTGILGLPSQTAIGFVLGFLRRDYGIVMAIHGLNLTANQMAITVTTITLFVPCIAQYFVMIKEQGFLRATAIVAFVIPFAFAMGGLLRLFLIITGINLGS